MNKVAYALSMTLGVAGVMAMAANVLSLPPAVEKGILLGIALAALNGIVNFLSLNWSFRKSNKAFFIVW